MDRESAYERLNNRTVGPAPAAAAAAPTDTVDPWAGMVRSSPGSAAPGGVWNQGAPPQYAPQQYQPQSAGPAPNAGPSFGQIVSHIMLGDGRRQGVAEALAKSMARSVGSGVGRSILRGCWAR